MVGPDFPIVRGLDRQSCCTGINRSEMVAENMVHEYGYSSIEAVEEHIISKTQK